MLENIMQKKYFYIALHKSQLIFLKFGNTDVYKFPQYNVAIFCRYILNCWK